MNNLHPIAQAVQSQGRGKDTQLVHMTPNEVAGMQALAKAHGGSLSINPSTGLPEAGILDSMLPTILGAGAMMIPGMQGVGAGMIGAGIGALQYMRTGSLEKGLMAGLGAYGGAGLGQSLMGAGALGNTGTMSPLNKASQEMLEQKAAVDAATTAATKQSKQVLLDQATKNLAAQQSQIAASSTFGENLSRAGTGLKAAAMSPSTFMDAYAGSGMDLARYGGAAAAAPIMDMMAPKDTGPLKADNERFDYTYDPGRASQADLDAQRAAYAARGITGGELKYFNPTYAGPNKTYAAKGGLLSLAEGGMPSDYEYDPVSQTYKKVAQAPTGAVAPVGVAPEGDAFQGPGRTARQEQFLNWEETTPEGKAHRDERMQALQSLASMGPLSALANAATGTKFKAPNFGTLFTEPQPFKAYARHRAARTAEGDPYSGNSGAFEDYSGMSQDELAESGGGVGAAKGGLLSLAAGGMSKGGFVVPADVVSALGNGSSDAGLRKLYALIGDVKPIKGKGDGLSDSIPTSIDGRQPARVADGEAYVNPKTVAKIGGGDAKKGAKKLYAMMDKIRQQAHGKKTQQREVNAKAVV
jgi:hypothetical protein